MRDFSRVQELIELTILDRRIRLEVGRKMGRPTQGYTVIDKRKYVREEEMHIPISTPAPSDTNGTIAVPATTETEEIKFALEPLTLQWGEYLMRHNQKAEATKWIDEFKPLLRRHIGKATLLQLSGRPVATFRRDAKLNLTQLRKEQPQIVEKYTRIIAEEKFDEAAFLRDLPDVHAAYRGESLRLVA